MLFMGWDEGGGIWGFSKMLNPRNIGFSEKQFSRRLAYHLQNHSKLCSLLSLLELLLSLPELCKVESCNLFSLLYLLFVGFDLPLELCSKFRHAVLVLPIFSLGKGELFALALSPLESLGCFPSARLSRCKLSLELTNLSLHLSHGSLSTLHSSILSICKATFKLSKLVSKRVLGSAHRCCMILLGSKFICETCSVHHGLLRFLLSIFGCNKHAINFSLQCVNGGLQLAFSSHVTSIDCLHIVYCTTSISNVSLELALSTLSTIQKGLALLNLSRERCSFALRYSYLLSYLGFCTGLIFKELDSFSKLSLITLDRLQSL